MEPIQFDPPMSTTDEQIALLIKPLPKSVVPSDVFLKQMRERLLQLDPNGKHTTRAA